MSPQSTKLILYTEEKLPNSVGYLFYPSMREGSYRDADDMMFFERELAGMKRMRKANSLQEEDAQLLPSARTARTGSRKDKQTTAAINAIAHNISKDLPPLKKIKKEVFIDEVRKRCADADTEFNTTDVREAWRSFPQEQKYGVGEK